ncbi:MAG: nuclear transport factor 2 family protein [Gammaproteobacteria bacterium]
MTESATAVQWDAIARQLDRLQSIEHIRDLSHRYALALDMRDWDAVASLFVDDIELPALPGAPRGRAALKQYLEAAMASFRGRGMFHANTNILVEFHDRDHAFGAVFCRSDDDCGTQFLNGSLNYWDEYVREGGAWLFARREVLYWYLADPMHSPLGPDKVRFPGMPHRRGQLPQFWGAWQADAQGGEGTAAIDDGGSFLRRIRRLPAAEHRPEAVRRQFVDWLGMPDDAPG